MLKIPFSDGFSFSSTRGSPAMGRASLGVGMPEESNCSWRSSADFRCLEVWSTQWQALLCNHSVSGCRDPMVPVLLSWC